MIVVLGRPALARESARPSKEPTETLTGPAAAVALAATRAGAAVELVGSIGDDPEGDRVAVLLGSAGVGHAALLRDPAGHTPVDGDEERGPLPRLDAGDVALGLGYLHDVRVLVLAERVPPEAEAAVIEAAGYHDAPVVAMVDTGDDVGAALAAVATVLAAKDVRSPAFAEMVGRYAASLDAGREAATAFTEATAAAGWERSGA